MATAPSSTYPSWLAREERLAGREPSGVVARIGEQAAAVADASPLGCRVRTEARVNVGAFLTLTVGDVAIDGWAAWRRGDEFGLDFAKPLDAATLAALTGAPR